VKSLVGSVVKALVKCGDTQYQYTITGGDEYVVIPLTCGDGLYSVSLWENIYDDKFAAIFAQDIQVQIQDPFLPFLYPNQFVNFNAGSQAVAMSQTLTTGASGEIQAIQDIYEYVIENVDYDFDKAVTVGANYLPVIDETLSTKKGICFDYAVLTAAMLRAQRIPARLVVGYAGSAYHAWIEVYSKESGWIRKEIQFDGQSWVLLDPTFASANDGRGEIRSIIGEGDNYSPRFMY
jgi:transglutaminase-like putative cysteine protease